MAYIKIFGIKSTVKKAVDYITNPDKTAGEQGLNLDLLNAEKEKLK